MSIKRVLIRVAIMAVLAIVFVSYLQPDFVFDIANRIVLCF